MQKSKKAFTMIELIFVIVILGVLATVAIPKFANIKEQADISSGRAEIATIRSAIVNERQTRLVRGLNAWIPRLSPVGATTLFTGDADSNRTLLMYGIKAGSGSGAWGLLAGDKYIFTVGDKTTSFNYDSDDGIFNCTVNPTNYCDKLVN